MATNKFRGQLYVEYCLDSMQYSSQQ